MKTLMSTRFLLLFIALISLSACSDDDDNMMVDPPDKPVTPGRTTVYNLGSFDVPNISGTATFTENSDNTVTIDLDLANTQMGDQHPAHIHANTAAEDGPILLTLGVVDGSTGKSSVTIGALDDGTVVNYDTLITLDGAINVHLDDEEELFWTIVAQGDIGQNVLTGESETFDLKEKMVPGIQGTVTFFERLNGEALSVIQLDNTPENGVHPAHIHNNSAVEGGGIAFSFNPIDGTSGLSRTNVATLDDGSSFGYDDVINFDGYINVHLSVDDLATIVAQGDIGENQLTGNTLTYTLNEKAAPGISGEVVFFERMSGEALAKISLMNTPVGGIHPAHIHNNDVATGGGIAFSFNPIDGDTGMSYTNVSMLDDGTSFVYENIDSFMGYINVHLSVDDLATIVAQGNIGASVDDGSGEDAITYAVSNSGNSAYIFNGNSLDDEANAEISLKRGMTYEFVMNTPGHPFYIKTTQSLGTSDTFDAGVTNNGASGETITFTVPDDAPDTLYYICEFHSLMTGTFNIID